MTSDARDERLAQNEVVFRTVNENIAQLAAGLGRDARYDFICECSSTDCFERLPLQLDEYEAVRRNGAWFIVRDGHQDIEIELVVETHPEFLVVAKDGVAGVVAEFEDPRG